MDGQTEAATFQQRLEGLEKRLAALEADLAQFGTDTEPTQADLVAAEMLRTAFDDVDLNAGAVVAVAAGPCDGVDLGI